ncbi:MAG: Crp/Fnr family transcriptional regulator [Gammaproteobacteria bacterium]|nr:Crp/Fnr family transcriptional regulator [Gammaproteobacteria bacterium]
MPNDAGDVFLDVFESAVRRELQPSQVLIHAGDPAEQVFNILDGMLMVSRPGLDGRRQVLSFLFTDNFVGLTAADRYNFTVEAVTPAVVAGQSREVLNRRLVGDPAAERAFIRMTYRVLENLVDLAFSLGQRTARERVAVFVLYLRHRYLLSQGLSPTADDALLTLNLPMSRLDIADFLGLKKETVSRSFAQIEAAGLLHRTGGRDLEIRDLTGLRELAGVLDFAVPARMPTARCERA